MPLEAVTYGPTWKKNPDGGWLLPELTLGWDVLAWTEEFLRLPDGPNAGDPWTYTDEQARFILWWYAIDRQGRFLMDDGVLRRAKGWGKDPVVGTVCANEFVGPCRFDGFDAYGQPVAKPHAASWVQVAAVAKDQTRTTMSLFPSLFSDAALAEYEIDLGKEIIYARHGRARIEAVTSSPRALEGPRTTFTFKNEVQNWIASNGGHDMNRVITRNAVKARDGAARRLAACNAPQPGEDSVGERDWEACQLIEQGKSRSTRLMYDSLEAPPELDIADEAQLRAGLRLAAGDSIWLNEDGHVETIYDPRNSVADSRRFYLNQIVAAEDAWVAPHLWDALKVEKPEEVELGEDIALGLDPSATDDHTVLQGCRISDGYVFNLGVWDPEDHGGEAPREEIDGAVRRAFESFTVVAFLSDLHPFESYVDQWAEDLGGGLVVKSSPKHSIAWDMRGKKKESTVEYERLHNEIVEAAFKHDGNRKVRQHFHNARRRPNAWGVSVGKESRESARKIDSVPSTMLARLGRRLYLTSGKKRKRKRTGRSLAV